MSWIVEEIEIRGGAVPFEEFMELALYHPIHGYYSGQTPRYGRDGDYLTAPTASEWYSRILARLLTEVSQRVGPIRFVDVASGDGTLIASVLESLESRVREVLSEVVSVERSLSMWGLQRERFRAAPVRLMEGLAEIEPHAAPTVLHASELYDAQPVVRVVMGDRSLFELWVRRTEGGLAWEERPAREGVKDYLARHDAHLDKGQIAEVNLGAGGLHRQLLGTVGGDGLVLVLDYGYQARRLYNPRGRRGGSLATFRRHKMGRDPLDAPGELDLSAHVNWDDLLDAGKTEGWTEVGLWTLAEFLIRSGIADEVESRGFGMEAELDAATISARQEVKRLLDPEGMGSDLKMLVQGRGGLGEVARSALTQEL